MIWPMSTGAECVAASLWLCCVCCLSYSMFQAQGAGGGVRGVVRVKRGVARALSRGRLKRREGRRND